MTQNIAIFDLDGTLALINHRLHFIDKRQPGGAKWDEFHAACIDDEPNTVLIQMFLMLRASGYDTPIFTGRSEQVRSETVAWLHKYTAINMEELDDLLVMRSIHDYTPDYDLKQSWFESMHPALRERVDMVFEDRARVVEMWRSHGITCLQVADGSF